MSETNVWIKKKEEVAEEPTTPWIQRKKEKSEEPIEWIKKKK
jgi:hypothetical protein